VPRSADLRGLTQIGSPAQQGPADRWSSPLPPALRAEALTIALESADRLTEPGQANRAASTMASQTRFPQSVHWTPYGFAQGEAGLAMMCVQLDRIFPGAGWDAEAQHFLRSGLQVASRAALPVGVSAGLSGIGLVTEILSGCGGPFVEPSSITAAVARKIDTAAQSIDVDHQRQNGMSVHRFDVISGLAGTGRYLLHVGVDDAVRTILRSLVDLILDTGDPPAWFTPSELIGGKASAQRFPSGCLNLGLAHGLPGPMALLALASRSGVTVPRQSDALADSIAALTRLQLEDDWGPNWPSMVRLPVASAVAGPPARAAWCYGAPGLARALWLAGSAVQDSDAQTLSIDAMRAVYRRPDQVRNLASATFCHGIAGLLEVTLRFLYDTGLPVFRDAAILLTEQLIEAFDPDSLLGFVNIEPGGGRVDHPGLLDGAAGVVLALMAAVSDIEPTWDQAFLLS
jgi:hypothetical protein